MEDDIYNENFKKKCKEIEEKTLFGKKLKYNQTSLLYIIAFLSLFLAMLPAWLQESFFSELDTISPIDAYTIVHLFSGVGMYILLYLVTRSKKTAIILFIIITTVYEPFEWYFGNLPFFNKLYAETIWNQVSDIVMNITGMILGYIIVSRTECFEESE